MRKTAAVLVLTFGLFTCASCTNMNKTQQGALSGGVLGAGAGAGIAAIAGGNAAIGAAIGGAFGGLAGGLIGYDQQKKSGK